MEAVEDCKSKLHQIINEHLLSNEFNTEETELVYQKIPMKSFTHKGEKLKGGKISTERLCVLFYVGRLVKS